MSVVEPMVLAGAGIHSAAMAANQASPSIAAEVRGVSWPEVMDS